MVNDPGMYKNIVNETNIYGIDAYPNGALATGIFTPCPLTENSPFTQAGRA